MMKKIKNTLSIMFNLKNIKDEMFQFNKRTYDLLDTAKYYSSESHLKLLDKPEETVIKLFENKLKDMKMLDIGVGGGRTTYHFAGLVKEYIGIDYSENMIKVCKERFKDIHFEVCDVRSMHIFEDNYFDFILFSAGGIDHVPLGDRLKALQEIKRVCKHGGLVGICVHNLQNIDKLFELEISINPVAMIRNIRRCLLFRLGNKSKEELREQKCVLINNYENRHKTIYMKPEEQIKQLTDIGFKNIRVYSHSEGKKLNNKLELDSVTDNRILYLCDIL
ncbi:class I SAM-dependent methyltransferase [candidate division WS5 bacterium]|uniref:Class I SAM-dependent methyltransferase n=1 Tax=candidate division WS5 bacterium TaxID=2093353 RepID=A0A419DDD4_9BACT|nr:MAG: class I SAM-dependent methyltransferase [candidate division WS5 bacterium]